MAIYENLDIYNKLKIEEEAINLLVQEQQIEETFILKTKEAQPTIYNGMMKSYLKRVILKYNGFKSAV